MIENKTIEFETRNTILIFDAEGKYLCQTDSYSAASKLTGASTGNIHRAANGTGGNNSLLSTEKHFFLLVNKSKSNKTYIKKLEKCLAVIIAYKETQGLPQKIEKLLPLI